MAYADASDLLDRKSYVTVGQLASDSGTAISAGGLLNNDVVDAALDSASGAIDAALMQGGRYTSAELTALTGNSLAYLKQICCEIAMAFLYSRKPTWRQEEYKAALEVQDLYLERLRKGENVFNIQANIDAGTPSYTQPSVIAVERQGLVRDRTLHYYPKRYSTSG